MTGARRHAEDRRAHARAQGFGFYVCEMAYQPGPFDDRAAELARGDREEYAAAAGRPWPKPDRRADNAALWAETEHLELSAQADREREAEYLASVECDDGGAW